MANYELVTEYPALANMFYELARGLQGAQALGQINTLPASLGNVVSNSATGGWGNARAKDIAYVASWHGAGPEVIADGLRMVADAIDPPPMVEAMREVAETLAQPKRPVNCVVCGETEHIEMDCPYLHGRAKHVCDDTCPAKYPSPCLCGNQPTHERDVCPFEPPEAEALGKLSVVSDDRINAQLGVNPKRCGPRDGPVMTKDEQKLYRELRRKQWKARREWRILAARFAAALRELHPRNF